ncbi:unnamed protein product [Hanseniaspora opuntiae]
MFKDMRIKKNHSSTEKASLNTSPSSTSWGTSSSKKKNNTIIKLNNTDGTPLTSPLKMTSVNSNENMDIETFI